MPDGIFKWVFAALLVATAVVVWIRLPGGQTGAVRQSTLALVEAVDRPAPAFSLPVIREEGRTPQRESRRGPEDLRGRRFLINFWASWCEACTGEAEGIDQLRQRLAGHGGLDVLAVATFDSREKALASDKILPMTWPVVIDADGGVAEAYGVAGLPQSFIVDDKGQILLHIRGKVAGEKLNKISRLLLAAEGAR